MCSRSARRRPAAGRRALVAAGTPRGFPFDAQRAAIHAACFDPKLASAASVFAPRQPLNFSAEALDATRGTSAGTPSKSAASNVRTIMSHSLSLSTLVFILLIDVC